MDSLDFPRLSLADVLNMTVEDVMNNRGFDLDHLSQEERDQCLDRIRYEYLRHIKFPSDSHTDKGISFWCVDF